ncbi:alanine--tRNA ligase [Embleya hyalina]|uniref:Alanine--tRNA ligase n=1 Tax=Embleya hyalina TaxID=516124 RepID=A0A401Z5C7_9ACTN|nr:alanine--tRNA ligase [Embleya hyalina]GCE02072.1 alanine--tRNA ligase [Embleya hyalina]
MLSPHIRSTFLDFFTARGHRPVPSGSLLPPDPSLFVANAGMNQFKPWFLGDVEPGFPRATSVQKCVRTVDVDNIGYTRRHSTFFEMLGNFSFGDYFKPETIAFAYELLTEHFGLSRDRLWITVYEDDDESERIWRAVGVPSSRIQRMGAADNFWSMGVPGPCGPCSDVTYDRGPSFGSDGGPAVDPERFVEVWSLVFMRSVRGESGPDGDFPILGELPRTGVDTGLGLDRLAAILQDVAGAVETDLLRPTLATVEESAGRGYSPVDRENPDRVSFEVVTDHARAIAFLLADGIRPGKEGTGYVLRRLMRRAIRHGRRLGIEGAILPPITASVVRNLGPSWPELTLAAPLIEDVTAREEESFDRVLTRGTRMVDRAIRRRLAAGESDLPAETVFTLYDSHGYPPDLTIEAARESGLTVDHPHLRTLLPTLTPTPNEK